MRTKTFAWGTMLSAVVLVGMSAPGHALVETKVGDATIGVGGRFNLMGNLEITQDTLRDKNRITLFQKNNRLEFGARQGAHTLYSQLALGGEDLNTGPNNFVNLTLLDMYANLATPFGNVVAGQYKVPFSGEQLTDGGNLLYNKRSLLEWGFQLGRDYGIGLQNSFGPVNTMFGIYAGGGRDIPERYIPVKMNVPLVAARVGIGDLGANLYSLPEPMMAQGPDGGDFKYGLYANAVYTKQTLVGHGGTLGQRKIDNTILLNAGFNPFLTGTKEDAEYWAAGVDYSMKSGNLAAEAEVNTARFSSNKGTVAMSGLRAQGTYDLSPVAFSLRYSALFPDQNVAATDATTKQLVPIASQGKPIQEIAPAITWRINGDNLKLIADLPIQLDTPVVFENGLGHYNLINQDVSKNIAAGKYSLWNQAVYVQGRLGLQYQF